MLNPTDARGGQSAHVRGGQSAHDDKSNRHMLRAECAWRYFNFYAKIRNMHTVIQL